jgi:hypothetical protein
VTVADFFVELHPPPKPHCAGCYKKLGADNDDWSCTAVHDDESTLVERVGRGVRRGVEERMGPSVELCGNVVGRPLGDMATKDLQTGGVTKANTR